MAPGTLVDGRYEILRRLGVGGMGAVYEARDILENQNVALKIILSERLANDTNAIRRFEREARAVGTISTPHIVRFIDAGRDKESGTPYLAMELLMGSDMRQLLKELGPLPPTLALRMAAQACRGLSKAHANGLVHRDIKPANIFVSSQGATEIVIKVLDFGVAKFQAGLFGPDSNTSLSVSGGMIGSPAYMSPEQALGNDDVDLRTDIWSMGVVLYEALSGRLPFGDRLPLGQVILAVCSEPAAPLQELAPWVPSAVAEIVHRATAKRREDRFQTAEEMLRAIEEQLVDSGAPITDSMLVSIREDERALHASDYIPQSGRPRRESLDARETRERSHTATDPKGRRVAPVHESEDLPPPWESNARLSTNAELIDSGAAEDDDALRASVLPRERSRLVVGVSVAAAALLCASAALFALSGPPAPTSSAAASRLEPPLPAAASRGHEEEIPPPVAVHAEITPLRVSAERGTSAPPDAGMVPKTPSSADLPRRVTVPRAMNSKPAKAVVENDDMYAP